MLGGPTNLRYFSFLAIAVSLPALAQVGNLQLSTSVLNFSAISGSSLPQSQIFGVSSTGAALPVNLSVRYFTATADGPTTPSNVTVTVNSAGLAPGVYNGTVSIAPSTCIAGVAIPVAQSTYVSNFNGIVNYVASTNVSWLRLTSVNNSTPAQTVTGISNSNLTVYVDPSGLSPGFYSANIAVGVTLPVSGTPVAFTASANSTGWLLVGPQSGNTGGSNVLTVSVSPREPAC